MTRSAPYAKPFFAPRPARRSERMPKSSQHYTVMTPITWSAQATIFHEGPNIETRIHCTVKCVGVCRAGTYTKWLRAAVLCGHPILFRDACERTLWPVNINNYSLMNAHTSGDLARVSRHTTCFKCALPYCCVRRACVCVCAPSKYKFSYLQ